MRRSRRPSARRRSGLLGRLSGLQAGVLGANDGIISVAAIAVGIAGATADGTAIVPATLAALVGGAISIAVSEYVSVSSQRDSETAVIERERAELRADPATKLAELAALYESRGLPHAEARRVARELSDNDALRAHLTAEVNLDPDDVVRPWRSAAATAATFAAGASLPFLTILLPSDVRVPATFAVVVVALIATGALGALAGGGPVVRGTVRVVLGGVVALATTHLLGLALGASGWGA